jgi:hypothetical protein
MPEPVVGQSAVLPKVVRISDAARAVLDRLDRGDALSAVLPQAKAVVDEHGSRIHSFWLEFEIHGLSGVPLAQMPPDDKDRKSGGFLFAKLHSASEPTDVTIESVIQEWDEGAESIRERKKVIDSSISEIERALESWEKGKDESARWSQVGRTHANHHLQLILLNDERARILNGVRAYLYDYVARIHRWAVAEQENQALLGPDYHIVVESLDALGSKEGKKLVGALELLRSPNPEHWSAAALMCRNVVLALGRSMWTVKGETYECQLAGRSIQIKGDKEKNCLLAFIDVHHERTDGDRAKRELEELYELASTIYERGSKGKGSRGVRHQEAQALVVDTFRLVSSLQRLTDLQPVTDLPSS